MTSKDLETLKKWGFHVSKGNIYIELVFKAEFGLAEISIQKDQLSKVSLWNVIDKVFKCGFFDGVKKGEKNTQERIKGILNIHD